ncbi:MAG: DUF5654 family protein [archaeon]
MSKITIGSIIKTSIITAFTIATALIWKDIIINTIHYFVPTTERQLFYEFIVAIIATIIIIVVIYLILQAQKETEVVWKIWKRRKKRK